MNMKLIRKTVTALLLLSCLLCLFACDRGNDDDLPKPEATVAYVTAVMKVSRPTKAVATTVYVLTDGTELGGKSTLQVQETGDLVKAKYAYEYQVLGSVNSEESVVTVKDTVYSSGNRIANFLPTGGYKFEAYTAQTTLKEITLPANASVVESDGGYLLTTTVSAAEADAFFGATLSAVGNVTLKIAVKDGTVVSASVTYATPRGNMSVVTAYTYEQESFSFVKPE